MVELEVIGADGSFQVVEHQGFRIANLTNLLVQQSNCCSGNDMVEIVFLPTLLETVFLEFGINIQTKGLRKALAVRGLGEFQNI